MNETSHDEKELNFEYLEMVYESFTEAVDKRDWSTAKAIAADTKDAGFELAARSMFWDIQRVSEGATTIEV